MVRAIAAGNPGCVYQIPRRDKVVALTLDDGPDSTTTSELLNILADNSASISLSPREQRYRCALGSIYPFDPQIPVPAFSAWVVRRNVRSGAIIILHDNGYKGRNTIKTLRKLLPDLTRKGYRIVTLSELAAPGQPATR